MPYSAPKHNETEDDYDEQHSKRLEEEFDADYDYPSQEVGHFEETEAEKEAAETTDSGESENELSSDSDSEEEKNYVESCSTTMSQQEESSHRAKKRSIEEVEEEEGEVYDDGDVTQPQVSSTWQKDIQAYFMI